MGYAGGTTDFPTYGNIGNHTETVQVDFNPEKITYDQLLEVLWNSHRYTRQTGMAQYKNAIFYHNQMQKHAALASKEALEKRTGEAVRTDIVPLNSFTPAEDYHQKYLLKNSAMKHLLNKFYTRHSDLVHSTAAARLNGYAGRYGTKEQLLREFQSLGVDQKAKKVLEKLTTD